MKESTVRRFKPIEIGFHWCQAILYALLFGTGAALFAQRLLAVDMISIDTLSLVHRIAGIALIFVFGQFVIISVFSESFRALWRTLGESLTWRLRDFLWLVKLPIHILWPRITMPPVGRLNPGQKLHLLIVTAIVVGFSISGIAMILVPGALGPWIVHTILFIPTCVLLAGHLYLALINPPTRRGLSGMITGRVSAEYARDHHPLWHGHSEQAHKGSYVSRRVMVTVIFATAAAAAVVWAYGPERIKERCRQPIHQLGTDAILPGRLHATHSDIARCTGCHQMFAPVPSPACLTCHDEIMKLAADETGVHGKFTAQCHRCHTDHAGREADILGLDAAAFNHNRARFALTGEHQGLPCKKCHRRKQGQKTRFVNLRFEACSNCHWSPHARQFKKTCRQCHTSGGWKGRHLSFSHQTQADFVLDRIHIDLPCNTCHTGGKIAVYTPLPKTCDACHTDFAGYMQGTAPTVTEKPSPHADRLACIDCHLPDRRSQSPAEYARICGECHNERYQGLFYDWSKSLHRRRLQAEKILSLRRRENSHDVDKLAAKIDEAKTIGFHNLPLARRGWDKIQETYRRR